MAEMGCTVHAYDPYVKSPNTTLENLYFHEIGIAHRNDINDVKNKEGKLLEFVTLKTAMLRNGDQGKRITYLKMDIEQNEVEVLREAIDSKFLSYTYLPNPTRLL